MKKFLKRRPEIVCSALIFLIISRVSGQDLSPTYGSYPTGISVRYGFGNYSIKDKYISDEKYTGTLPYYSIAWAKGHDNYIYRLEMKVRNSNEIHNYNVSTEITQLLLTQGFIYPLKGKSLLKKDLNIWIGPSTEFFLNYNKPIIAVSGFDYAESYAALVSLGLNVDAEYNLSDKFQVESYFSTTFLSLGFRTVDQEEDNQSPVNPLTMFSGVNSSFDIGIRYHLFKRLSVRFSYELDLVSISAWEKLISDSNNFMIGFNYSFRK